MGMWKTLRVSHIPTPPTTTTDNCPTKRYTNIPLGTKDRSGQVCACPKGGRECGQSGMLGRYSSAIRAACANERSCGSVRGAISDDRPYRDLIDPVLSVASELLPVKLRADAVEVPLFLPCPDLCPPCSLCLCDSSSPVC